MDEKQTPDEPEAEGIAEISDDELDDIAAGGPVAMDTPNTGQGF